MNECKQVAKTALLKRKFAARAKARSIVRGSTLWATLNAENFPFGQHEDLRNELLEMVVKGINSSVKVAR